MKKKYTVGVLGCANIAERMMIPAFLQAPGFELKAVASRTEAKAKNYADKFQCSFEVGYQSLLDRVDIDLIYMPLPTGLHLEWALKALNAGKHVLIEKSLAENFEDAQTIIALAKEKQLLVQENFMFAFHKQFQFIKSLLEKEEIGAIRCMRSSFGFPPFPSAENIRYQKNLGGGALLDAGAYTLKIAQLLFGFDLEFGSAAMNWSQNAEVDIFGGIFLTSKDGISIETAYGFDQFYQCNLEIWGAKGKIIAERIFTAGPGIKPVVRIEKQSSHESIEIEVDNHFLNLINDFGKTLDDGNFEAKYEEILNQSRLIDLTFTNAKKFRKD